MIGRFCMRYAIVALFALGGIGIARPALAADPSPASILIARQIVEIKGANAIFEPMIRGVVEKVKDMFMQTNFMWSKDLNEAAAVVNKDYASRINEVYDTTARIYASHFTEAELKSILSFYQSPLGKKMLTEEPKALDESMASAGKWADSLSDEVLSKMRAEMKKRGHDL